jgi:hypothetical protein
MARLKSCQLGRSVLRPYKFSFELQSLQYADN